jgi:predicted amidohydrolase
MLDRATVGIAQWLAVPGDPDQNLRDALGYIGELSEAGCDLIVLPELWPSGFDWGTLAEDVRAAAEPLGGPRTQALAEAARSARVWLAGGSVPELVGEEIFNTALLFARDGELVATHKKCHLYEPLGEEKSMVPGRRVTVCETDDFGTVGLSICFDGDFPEMARAMRDAGARFVIHPSAYEAGAATWWDLLYPANALANGQWWIMANQCGASRVDTLLGASQIIAPSGEIVASAARAGVGETPHPAMLVAEINLRAELANADVHNQALWQLRRPDVYEASK